MNKELKLCDLELSKLLKEAGFNICTLYHYFEDGTLRENIIEDTYGYYGDEYTVEYEELINNWNDKFLMKKDGSRCFGCSKTQGYFETYSAPTLESAKQWFREVHNIDIIVKPWTGDEKGVKNYAADVCIFGTTTYIKCKRMNTYNQALSAGLKEAIKLIKK